MTKMADILTGVRRHITETAPRNWSDAELLDLANLGIKDLWRKINDLYKHYFVTIDLTNVSLRVGESALFGVPDDVFRIVTIEPRIVGCSNANPGLIFKPADYNDPRFVTARARGPVAPNNTVIYFDIMMTGAPISAPTIQIAPQITSAADLKLVYNQVLQKVDEDDANPIPGESDNAIIAWTIAYARAKERDDRAPDPEWLAIYATDKSNLMQQLTPRQIQESDVAEGMFGEADDFGWGN